jgi:hypothetical protein
MDPRKGTLRDDSSKAAEGALVDLAKFCEKDRSVLFFL